MQRSRVRDKIIKAVTRIVSLKAANLHDNNVNFKEGKINFYRRGSNLRSTLNGLLTSRTTVTNMKLESPDLFNVLHSRSAAIISRLEVPA